MIGSTGKVLFWDRIKEMSKMEDDKIMPAKTNERVASNLSIGTLIDQMLMPAEEREAYVREHGELPNEGTHMGNTGDNLGDMLCLTAEQAEEDLRIIRENSI